MSTPHDTEQSNDQSPDPKLRGEVSALTASLVKAMNQSGYYDADHPAAQDITDEPYRQLSALSGRVPEVVYGLWGGTDQDQLALDGIFEKEALLADILGDSSPYLEKFTDYFQRNRIVSLSVKPTISSSEFQRFIGVFAEQNRERDGDEDGLALSTALKEQKIMAVSLLVWADLVGGRDLAWPVRIALSRMSKDISKLPLFAQANNHDIAEAKRLLVGDMVRPLRRADMVKELLINCDVVSERVDGWTLEDIESTVVRCLSMKMVESTCWELIDEWVARGEATESKEGTTRILRRLVPVLAKVDDPATFDLFKRLHDLELIAFGDFPTQLQRQVRVGQSTDKFETNPDAFLAAFTSPQSTERFRNLAKNLVAIFPELLDRKHLESARKIIEAVDDRAGSLGESDEDGAFVAKALDRLRSTGNLDLTMTLLEQPKPTDREHIRQILQRMGPAAVDRLLHTLEHHESTRVRKDCCTTLIAMDPNGRDKVLAAMSAEGKPWYFTRNLCTVLGATPDERSTAALARATRHEHVKVRLEALSALGAATDSKATSACLNALNDVDDQVQRRALLTLSGTNCSHPLLLKKLGEWLVLKANKSEEAPVPIQMAAVRVVEQLGNIPMEQHGSTETVLVQLLRSAHRLAIVRKLKGSHVDKDDSVKVAACKALATIGTDAALDALTEASAAKSELLRQVATKAIAAIQARQ